MKALIDTCISLNHKHYKSSHIGAPKLLEALAALDPKVKGVIFTYS